MSVTIRNDRDISIAVVRTSATQYLTRDKAKSRVQRSSRNNMHVPNGWPPPKMTSRSFSPDEVKWMPPVQGLTPRCPRSDGGGADASEAVFRPGAAAALAPARRKADGMISEAVERIPSLVTLNRFARVTSRSRYSLQQREKNYTICL